MFINCPHCRALVATDPVTDQPPGRCPRCSVALREPVTWSSLDVADAVTQQEDTPSPARAGDGHPDRGAPSTATRPAAPAARDAPVPAATPSELAAYVVVMNAQPPASPVGSLATWLKPPVVTEVTYTRRDEDPLSNGMSANDGRVAAVSGFPGPIDAPSIVETRAADGVDAIDGDRTRSMDAEANTLAGETKPHDEGPDDASTADASTPPFQDDHAAKTSSAVLSDATPPRATSVARAAPSFASGTGARSATATTVGWKIPAAIATLVVLLLLQLTLADRAHLAADARWRPAVLALCGALRCSVPAWREPEAFLLLDRNVQPDAGTPGVLRVTATFRNDAQWAQPWPRLRLTLSDIDGNAVAVREFAPRDYLGATPAQGELATGQSASIAMDVIEPGARSVAFDFQLH